MMPVKLCVSYKKMEIIYVGVVSLLSDPSGSAEVSGSIMNPKTHLAIERVTKVLRHQQIFIC